MICLDYPNLVNRQKNVWEMNPEGSAGSTIMEAGKQVWDEMVNIWSLKSETREISPKSAL